MPEGDPNLGTVVSFPWVPFAGVRFARVYFIGSVRVGVPSLDFFPVFVDITVSFLPLGRVRLVTWSSTAAFFIAAFLAAVAVCVLLWKCAVARPGDCPSMFLRAALVRPEARE